MADVDKGEPEEWEDDDYDNDNAFGRYCCMHRRWYCLIVSVGFLLYGLLNCLYWVIYAYVHIVSMKPSNCTGPGCGDLLTCPATKDSSYEFRLAVMTIGSLVFGAVGSAAILQRYATEMWAFTCWMVATCVIYLLTAIFDAAYIYICDYNYPTNLMQEAVFWPIPEWPVNHGIKYELRQLETYPVAYVNDLSHHNVGVWYVNLTLIKVCFFAFIAYQCWVLSQHFHYGAAGMGINFSIEGWRKRLLKRYEMNEVAYNTFDMACATAADMGWTEDEFLLQRPLRQPHMYRGPMGPMGPGMMLPGGAARAYDGFQDNRRNVLL